MIFQVGDEVVMGAERADSVFGTVEQVSVLSNGELEYYIKDDAGNAWLCPPGSLTPRISGSRQFEIGEHVVDWNGRPGTVVDASPTYHVKWDHGAEGDYRSWQLKEPPVDHDAAVIAAAEHLVDFWDHEWSDHPNHNLSTPGGLLRQTVLARRAAKGESGS